MEEIKVKDFQTKKNNWQKPTKLQIMNLILSITAFLIATTSLILRLLK